MDETRTDEPQDSDSAIKVNDRRLFTADGRLRHEVTEETEPEEEEAPPSTAAAPPEPPASPERATDPGFQREPVEEPEGVDFTMLLNAMAEPALLFLGEIPHPGTGEPQVDLERARIQIDMLDLLRVRCRGNLSAAEDSLLDRILYQLRMLYLSRSNQQPPPAR